MLVTMTPTIAYSIWTTRSKYSKVIEDNVYALVTTHLLLCVSFAITTPHLKIGKTYGDINSVIKDKAEENVNKAKVLDKLWDDRITQRIYNSSSGLNLTAVAYNLSDADIHSLKRVDDNNKLFSVEIVYDANKYNLSHYGVTNSISGNFYQSGYIWQYSHALIIRWNNELR